MKAKIRRELLSNNLSVDEAICGTPSKPGYYAIFLNVDQPTFYELGEVLTNKRLLYLGIATKSLHERLVGQELLHKRPGTYFRSLGASLGYTPIFGHLNGCKNKSNYRFSKEHTNAIVVWQKANVVVSWASNRVVSEATEKELIAELNPLLNIQHNPNANQKLKNLRENCRIIARKRPRT